MADDFGQRLRDAVDDLKRRHSTGDPADFGPLDRLVSEAAGGGVQPSSEAPQTVTPDVPAEAAPAAADEPSAPAAPETPAVEQEPAQG